MRKVMVLTMVVIAVGAAVDFSGQYTVFSEREVFEQTLVVYPMEDFYQMEWISGEGDVHYENGLEVSGYLGAGHMMAGGPVGIYALDAHGITGLYVTDESDEVFTAQTQGTRTLEPSSVDLAGLYEVSSHFINNDETYTYTMLLTRWGDTWQAVISVEDSENIAGYGLAVDNVLALAFDAGDWKIVKVYEIQDNTLKGRFVYSYYNPVKDKDAFMIGFEIAVRAE